MRLSWPERSDVFGTAASLFALGLTASASLAAPRPDVEGLVREAEDLAHSEAFAPAAAKLETALREAERRGDTASTALCLDRMGMVLDLEGDSLAGTEHHERALVVLGSGGGITPEVEDHAHAIQAECGRGRVPPTLRLAKCRLELRGGGRVRFGVGKVLGLAQQSLDVRARRRGPRWHREGQREQATGCPEHVGPFRRAPPPRSGADLLRARPCRAR